MKDFQSSAPSRPIHVYLCFRGDDNSRTIFTDKLRCSLEGKGLRTYGDDKKSEKGNSIIPPHLLEAIEESLITIVIFSKNFAASTWCLQELSKIAERISEQGHTVIPVFYEVDPYEVRNQTDIYEKAFSEHEKRFVADLDKVQKWRLAMTKVANLCGWVVENEQITKIIQVAIDINRLINRKLPQIVYADHQQVGMQSRVEDVEKLMDLDSNDQVRVIGICGMCKIGKTTVAAVMYNRISHQFDASYFLPFDSCFLPNVGEVSNSVVVSPLLQCFRETLNMEFLELKDIEDGVFLANPRLGHNKTLIVLDGVNHTQNLKTLNLAVKSNWFGGGSRIIITTRDERVLKLHEVNHIYKVKPLAKHEALQLFCEKAFKSNFLKKQYEEHANNVLKYCNGLPLAINILGTYLGRLSASEWGSALARIKNPYGRWIIEVHRNCFDELDHMKKQIFLDVSCFFRGKEIDSVKEILQDCGFFGEEITLMVEKSLIAISDQKIEMHGIFQEMGQEIVRQESPQEPGERSRLWYFDDIYHVMQKNTATKKIEAIVLNMEDSIRTTLRVEAFSQMSNLRMLIFH